MLISFSLENWRSFKNVSKISMIASRQRTHQEHLSQIQKYQTRITPVAALYGGNASGKSNICTALKFAKDMVIKGTKTRDQKIDVQPFLLSNDTKDKPSKFRFELLVNECLYEFYFAVTEDRIYEEKLTKIGLTKEQVLYERENQNFIINENNNQNKSHLDNIKISTRENELFLTKTIENNNSSYQDPYDWFFHILKIISPISTFAEPEYLTNKNHPLYEEANSILRELDTGILHLGTEVDKEIDLNKLDKEAETLLNVLGRLNNEKYIKYSQNGEKLVKKLISYHMCEDGTETQFNWKQESDGTKRLFDLIPAFIQIKPSVYGVYIIDELDRSLHHLLLRRLLKKFLNSCNADTREQIIFTTHDLLLMDQELMRRDEMFAVERDNLGASSITPINEYRGLRSDKIILKSYLQGRLGGIPRL